MTDQRIIRSAQDEGKTDAQLTRSNRGADYEATEEKARQFAKTHWGRSRVYQKDWTAETEKAFTDAYVTELLSSNPK